MTPAYPHNIWWMVNRFLMWLLVVDNLDDCLTWNCFASDILKLCRALQGAKLSRVWAEDTMRGIKNNLYKDLKGRVVASLNTSKHKILRKHFETSLVIITELISCHHLSSLRNRYHQVIITCHRLHRLHPPGCCCCTGQRGGRHGLRHWHLLSHRPASEIAEVAAAVKLVQSTADPGRFWDPEMIYIYRMIFYISSDFVVSIGFWDEHVKKT